jgi:hypothetical protein
MPDCTVQRELFVGVGRRRIEVGFDGGDVTSDAGLLLICKADEHMGLLARVAAVLPDPRDPQRVEHSLVELLANGSMVSCKGMRIFIENYLTT